MHKQAIIKLSPLPQREECGFLKELVWKRRKVSLMEIK